MKTLLLLGIYFFCHIPINKTIPAMEPIVEIPPVIYDHMIHKTTVLIQVSLVDGSLFSDNVKVGILTVPESGKHYLLTDYDNNWSGSYLIGYYILKDI
jgi:hypothetical protein